MTSVQRAPEITIVVVLYRTTPGTSRALESLHDTIGAFPGRFAVEVHDNSPNRAAPPMLPGVEHVSYTWHPDNPGLAEPYNAALEAADSRGSTWLVLLDQDTGVTRAYLECLVNLLVGNPPVAPDVAVAVPLLVQEGGVLSPHKPMRFRTRPLAAAATYGPTTRYSFLNSGSAVHVPAARAVGGFPNDYPLDFLDHAMACRLRGAGYSLLVMESRLEHNLAILDISNIARGRLRSIYEAEERFYVEFGRPSEKLWLLVRRAARGALLLTRMRTSVDRSTELHAVSRAAWCMLPNRKGTHVAP